MHEARAQHILPLRPLPVSPAYGRGLPCDVVAEGGGVVVVLPGEFVAAVECRAVTENLEDRKGKTTQEGLSLVCK